MKHVLHMSMVSDDVCVSMQLQFYRITIKWNDITSIKYVPTQGERFHSGRYKELHSFRFGDGTSFPRFYMEFAEQYGYGLTCGEFLIYIPMGDYCDSFVS